MLKLLIFWHTLTHQNLSGNTDVRYWYCIENLKLDQ